MKHRRRIPLTAAGLCLALSLSAGWLWHALSETKFEARARLAGVGGGASDSGFQDESDRAAMRIADEIFSPEVLSAAVDLLHERGVALATTSPFDSETDYLLERMHASCVDDDTAEVIGLSCISVDGDEALQMLTAVIDAFLVAARSSLPSTADGTLPSLETESRELSDVIARQDRAIAGLLEQLESLKSATAAERVADGPISLEDQLAEARRAVLTSAEQLEVARRDLDRHTPAEVVAGRLAEGPTKTKILEQLSGARLHDELRQQEAVLAKSSVVYGRNHPRMAELREKTEGLRRQAAAVFASSEQVDDGTNSPRELVVSHLEGDLAAKQSREKELASVLEARNDRIDARQGVETRIGEARQELAFLHGEHDRIRREIARAHSEETARLPAVIEQPTLSPDPIAPRTSLQMAVSCVAGMALYLFLLRQLRTRQVDAPIAAEIPQHFQKTAVPARRRERFLSEEEQRLARLRRLSGAVPART
jgi:hypothetical protein